MLEVDVVGRWSDGEEVSLILLGMWDLTCDGDDLCISDMTPETRRSR